MSQVFISTAKDTQEAARSIAEGLNRCGITTWLDAEQINAGDNVGERIQQALDEAKDYLIFLGPDSTRTRWQDLEYQNALQNVWSDERKRLISVLIGDAHVPPFLKRRLTVRLDDPFRTDTDALDRLVSILRSPATGLQPSGDDHSANEERKARFRELREIVERMRQRESHSGSGLG